MFLDQSDFIAASINTAMNEPGNMHKNFTIVAHSVGCLQGMFIENDIPKNRLQNMICIGSPVLKSKNPTMYVNNDLAFVYDHIRD